MGTIDSMKSVLTQSALDALFEKFHIPDDVHPELPGRNDRIRNSHVGFGFEENVLPFLPTYFFPAHMKDKDSFEYLNFGIPET
ncbi:hypothetical protein Tco_0403359 [Tanacetum coccineum]